MFFCQNFLRKCLSTSSKGTRNNQKKYLVVFEKYPKYTVFFYLTDPSVRPSIQALTRLLRRASAGPRRWPESTYCQYWNSFQNITNADPYKINQILSLSLFSLFSLLSLFSFLFLKVTTLWKVGVKSGFLENFNKIKNRNSFQSKKMELFLIQKILNYF